MEHSANIKYVILHSIMLAMEFFEMHNRYGVCRYILYQKKRTIREESRAGCEDMLYVRSYGTQHMDIVDTGYACDTYFYDPRRCMMMPVAPRRS